MPMIREGMLTLSGNYLFISPLQVTPFKRGPVQLIVPFPSNSITEEEFYDSWQCCALKTLNDVKAAVDTHFENICHYGMVPFVCSVSNSNRD